ncbi:pilus assembly protein TadG-related protein [Nonomuraea jabiensis]|uniref:Flp pilus assembly protein TadG n=2 Tax=Nonomuraea TaxID=83681 RepID=A0A7W9G231_9ACTN|nr:pilus assembly protein TadG-related protein [Nonomuraea jabiensis]MBB5775741.1 Flp pilus assembly protein TadG [Nonomuraea jabiensis]
MNAERGSVTLFTAVVAFALLLCAGLMVDGGAKIQAYREAYAAAEEAARAGAGQMNTGHAYTSGQFKIDPAQAANAARAYLSSAGHAGTVSTTGNQVRITVTVTKPTVLIS